MYSSVMYMYTITILYNVVKYIQSVELREQL